MAKFRIRLKVQALELEIDGEREDIHAISSAVQQQFAGLVLPAEGVVDTKQLGNGSGGNGSSTADDDKGKKSQRKQRGSSRGSGEAVGQPIEFRHDGAKYGNPIHEWSITEKLIWLLYILKSITETKELSGPQLAATFNQYFKGSGRIHPPHVTMHLNKAKLSNPPPIGEDKGNYYLTDSGDKQAEQLIQAVLNSAK